ncbi:MAG: gamma carbonic anhydrase family protein [Desulfobulbaceae bacterium]|nr:gamma carbonic anhydrase family protein [Candidatus Kapabacteria bacterium]MBS4001472.1 gamma carbonic anhydrase family protein [Desulfobulbaceae bacterium]
MKLENGNSGSIITHHGFTPKIPESAFLCEGVRIIGDVELGENVSVWFNTVIRGDVNYIRIGDNSNIQDMSMLHVTNKVWPLIIERNVSIAHSVTVHGCTLKEGCLVGIGANVLDGAVVGEYALVAAGTVVREGFEVPPMTLIAGVPGKVIRELKPAEIERVKSTPYNYINYVAEYRKEYEQYLQNNKQ